MPEPEVTAFVDDEGKLSHAVVRDRMLDVRRARDVRHAGPFDKVVAGVSALGAPSVPATSLAADIWGAGVGWLRKNTARAVLFGLIGFAVGWLANIYIMARRYDGYNVPSGAGATGRGNAVWGSLIWMLGSIVVSTVVSYRLAVGKERFWQEVRSFPGTMRATVRSDGDRALVHMLWGFAGAMVAVLILAPSFSGLMAVGVLVVLGSALRPLVTGVTLAVWRAVGKRFFPGRPVQPTVASLVVASLGTALAFAAGFVVTGTSGRFVVGLLAAGAAYFITRQAAGGAAVLLVAVGLSAGAWTVVSASPAYADDGGWAECGSSLQSWIGCGGSVEVWLRGLLGGFFSGIGSMFGSMFGGGGGGGGDPTKYADMTDSEKRRHLQDYLTHKYPGITPEQAAEAARQIVDGESTYGGDLSAVFEELEKQAAEGLTRLRNEVAFLGSPEFLSTFGEEFWKDLSSGAQLERINATIEAMLKAPGGMLEGAWDAGGALWENREALMAAGMEWIATASTEDILAALANAPGAMTGAMIDDYKGKLTALYEASLAGDDAKVADIIGTMAGEAQFEVLLGAGMGKAMEKGGDFLKGARKAGPDDVDVPGGPGKGGKPDGDGTGTPPERPAWLDEDPYRRPSGPLSPQEIKERYQQLEPGERLKLTPEEAAAWGGYEKDMLIRQRENALLFGKGSDAADKPWVELKRGNEDALRLREEGYYENLEHNAYNLKPNHIKSKSLDAEEMRYVPEGVDYQPGEVVSFRPDPMPKEGEVSPEAYQRLLDRAKEMDKIEASKMQTTGSGPVIDRYGNQVTGQAELRPDGRWYTRTEMPDAQGRRPYDDGYQQTWSDWGRTAGDNDTFAIGGGQELVPGRPGTDLASDRQRPVQGGWEMTENERLTYAASDGSVPGEGNTPIRYPQDPHFDQGVHDSTMQKGANEGVLLIDADGYYVTQPGSYYTPQGK
jgi:hypothetical protein